MPFIVKPIESLTLPLKIYQPTGVGKFEEHDLTVTWKYLTDDERDEINEEIAVSRRAYNADLKAYGKGDLDEPPVIELTDQVLCERLILNIDGMLTPEKEEIPYTTKMLGELFKMNYVAKPLGEQLVAVISGVAAIKEQEKN
jgi:hypothetical protein